MTTAHDFTTIAVADILDALTDAIDAIRASTAYYNTAWMTALDKAWDYILPQDTISYDRSAYAIRVESATEPGRFYISNGDCQCRAFTHGAGVCWHRAAARLVRRALELHDLAAELVADATEDGEGWYGAAEGRIGASWRHAELETYAREWDVDVAQQRAALSRRIGQAQAAAIAAA